MIFMKSAIFVTELTFGIAVTVRVVQSAENSIFHKKKILRNKNISHIVSDVVAGVGAPWDHSKSSKSMIVKVELAAWHL